MEATQNVKVEKDYKGFNWELTLGLTLNVSSHKLKSEPCDILKFFFPFFRNHVSIHEIIQSFQIMMWPFVSLILVGFLFSFKLKTIPNYYSRCVSIRFLKRIDSYPIRLVSLSGLERSNPYPL